MNNFLYYFTLFLIFATYLRSFLNIKNLVSNINWLVGKNKAYRKRMIQKVSEKFIICIPMLREQKLVKETLHYFSSLNYPKDKFRIVVVTTYKEIVEKRIRGRKLKFLANDLLKGGNLSNIIKNYQSLFTDQQLAYFYKLYRGGSYRHIISDLNKFYERASTTFELASTEASKINSESKSELITVLNYPHKKGVMSHQINYAVNEISKNSQSNNLIFAVYNADSRPNKNTLKYVNFAFRDYEYSTGIRPNIVQQSSLFTLNYNNYPTNIGGFVLKAASLFQTKWTLIHELTRFRSQSEHVIKKSNNILSKLINTKISHCVGHGLFVRFGLLVEENLPTETINEDLPFGFYQCCKGEPILPLPILENSETPTSFNSLINQKKFWFTPYLQYLKCREMVLKLKRYRSRLETELLTIQAEIAGLIWLIQSFVLFAPLFVGIYLISLPILITWLIGLFLYWFLPIRIIYVNLNKLETIAGKSISKTNLLDFIPTSFSGLYVLLTHSLGPILCINDFALAKVINKPIIKHKTER